jgi:hypothetical protein
MYLNHMIINGVKRIVEYYDIDLYKIKANWKVKDIYEFNL